MAKSCPHMCMCPCVVTWLVTTCDVTELHVVNKARRKTKRMENISGNTAQNSKTMVPITVPGKDLGYLRVYLSENDFFVPRKTSKIAEKGPILVYRKPPTWLSLIHI